MKTIGAGTPGPGRPPGKANHLTTTVKDTVLKVFQDLQTDPKLARYNLMAFAQENTKDFYQIAARLIPTEVNTHMDVTVTFQEERNYPGRIEAYPDVIKIQPNEAVD